MNSWLKTFIQVFIILAIIMGFVWVSSFVSQQEAQKPPEVVIFTNYCDGASWRILTEQDIRINGVSYWPRIIKCK